jgi:hypothetical protein
MTKAPKTFRIGSIVWAIVLGVVVVILGGGILLPSTKRARLQFHQPETGELDAMTQPATQP